MFPAYGLRDRGSRPLALDEREKGGRRVDDLREGLEGRSSAVVGAERNGNCVSDVMGDEGYASSVGVIGADAENVARGNSMRVDGSVGRGDVGAGRDGRSLGVLTVWRLEHIGCLGHSVDLEIRDDTTHRTALGLVPFWSVSRKVPSLGLRSAARNDSFALLAGDLIVLMGDVAIVNDERRLRMRGRAGVPGCTLICSDGGLEAAYESDSVRGCEASESPDVKSAE
jgi:hypothetical protein